jgi:tRNA1Val (adenine37-N6)-methyltransferase
VINGQGSMTVFRFQQFVVEQQQSAMKICTDSLLFGAMVPLKAGDNVLDIGTGTGVLSLMVAQLGAATVTAVELSNEAYQEAAANFAKSPWVDKMEAFFGDIRCFSALGVRYDLVMSNPPFFEKHLQCSLGLRRMARHNDYLSYADLLACIGNLLAEKGLFYVLLPAHTVDKFHLLALQLGLYLTRRTDYRGVLGAKSKVAALTFSKIPRDLVHIELVIYSSDGVYSEMAAHYLSPFLLRFGKHA